MSYPGHSLGKSYSSAEVQSVYLTDQADWASCMYIEEVWFSNVHIQRTDPTLKNLSDRVNFDGYYDSKDKLAYFNISK